MIPAAEIEAVARAACKEMGLDADELAPYVGGNLRQWQMLAGTARTAIAMSRAIEAVKGAGK